MDWKWETGIAKWTTGAGSILCDFTQLPEGSGSWTKGVCLLDDETLVRAFMDAWLNYKTVSVVADDNSAPPYMRILSVG